MVGAVCWLLYVVWQSPHRSDLATYGAFAFPIVLLAAGWVTWAWRRARTSPANSATEEENLNHAADRLAAAVRAQWEKAAGERGLTGASPIPVTWGKPSVPMTGPLAAAIGSQRFDPLPGLPRTSEAQLAAGQISDLHSVYGGLGSGRLVIAGPPGSGKSGSAVLLILAALKYREQVSAKDKPKVPVPILVTAHDWDPRSQPVAKWLTQQLKNTYPLFVGAAGATTADALMVAGKIMVIIDGLDEVAADLRPIALQALSQQASFRIVVLSRTAEMASAASRQGVLQSAAAIELCAINAAEAASYLERVQLDPPPDGWRDLIDRIRIDPASPLSKALDNPLTLTLVRDTYQSGDDARELLKFCDISLHGISRHQIAEDITDHLLDRILPAAYAHRPGQPLPPYDLATAHYALTKIATRMNHEGTRDLQWWHIPTWASAAQRFVVGGLIGGLAEGLALSAISGLRYTLVSALWGVFAIGFLSVLDRPPQRLGKVQLQASSIMSSILTGFGLALAGVLVFGLLLGVTNGLKLLVVGIILGLILAFMVGFQNAIGDPDSTSSVSPATSRRDDRKYAIMAGIMFGLVIGVVVILTLGLGFGLVVALVFGVLLAFTLPVSWPVSLATIQIAIKWRTPVHLMRFLDDAHKRNVLRIVGPVYQFRHARLQDRLVARSDQLTTAA